MQYEDGMRESDKLGGFDPNDYITPSEKRSCDKWHHFWCSLAHQKNHIKHLKEVEENEPRNGQQNSNRRQRDNGESSNP